MRCVTFLLLSTIVVSAASLALDDTARAQNQSELDQPVARIERIFGVRVHYAYNRNSFFPKDWRTTPVSARGWQIRREDAARTIPVVESFLNKYSKPFLRSNLKDIYLLSRMRIYGQEFGGTYSDDAIYVVNDGEAQGFSESYLEATMHAEFSSILFCKYDFPVNQWSEVNDKDWEYKGYGNNFDVLKRDDLLDRSHELLGKGFLCRYAQASPEEDFNSYLVSFIYEPRWLRSVAANHKRIDKKLRICRDFYKKIGSGLRLE
jgi:hypothetical protein